MNKFITFEGIEGSGKSTQSKKLHEFLLSQKIDSILTREPGGAKASERIREILLADDLEKLEGKTELLLNFAARSEHIAKLIKPALLQNKNVICDRFFDSTFAYQGSAFNLGFEIVQKVKDLAIGDFKPDITFLIDLPVKEAFARIGTRSSNNRYEQMGLDFHQRVREGFLKLNEENDRIVLIDGSQNPDEIFSQIINILKINSHE